jgi:hypothetical protein
MSRALWIVQVLLALVFAFSGSVKLLVPVDVMQQQLPLPGLAIHTIGTLEVLGAIGVVLPALLRILPGLTPLAAAGLALLMVGATVLTPVLTPEAAISAILPFTLGLLSAFVAYGRTLRAPIAARKGSSKLQLAAR